MSDVDSDSDYEDDDTLRFADTPLPYVAAPPVAAPPVAAAPVAAPDLQLASHLTDEPEVQNAITKPVGKTWNLCGATVYSIRNNVIPHFFNPTSKVNMGAVSSMSRWSADNLPDDVWTALATGLSGTAPNMRRWARCCKLAACCKTILGRVSELDILHLPGEPLSGLASQILPDIGACFSSKQGLPEESTTEDPDLFEGCYVQVQRPKSEHYKGRCLRPQWTIWSINEKNRPERHASMQEWENAVNAKSTWQICKISISTGSAAVALAAPPGWKRGHALYCHRSGLEEPSVVRYPIKDTATPDDEVPMHLLIPTKGNGFAGSERLQVDHLDIYFELGNDVRLFRPGMKPAYSIPKPDPSIFTLKVESEVSFKDMNGVKYGFYEPLGICLMPLFFTSPPTSAKDLILKEWCHTYGTLTNFYCFGDGLREAAGFDPADRDLVIDFAVKNSVAGSPQTKKIPSRIPSRKREPKVELSPEDIKKRKEQKAKATVGIMKGVAQDEEDSDCDWPMDGSHMIPARTTRDSTSPMFETRLNFTPVDEGRFPRLRTILDCRNVPFFSDYESLSSSSEDDEAPPTKRQNTEKAPEVRVSPPLRLFPNPPVSPISPSLRRFPAPTATLPTASVEKGAEFGSLEERKAVYALFKRIRKEKIAQSQDMHGFRIQFQPRSGGCPLSKKTGETVVYNLQTGRRFARWGLEFASKLGL